LPRAPKKRAARRPKKRAGPHPQKRAGPAEKEHAGWIARTQGELAQFFGLSLVSITKWREVGMPGEPGRWDLGEVTRWARARDRRQREEEKREDPGERLKSYRAELVREKLLETRRVTMRVADHERHCVRLCTLFRSALLSLANSLASQIEACASPSERDLLVRERCHELLEDLAGDRGGGAAAPEGPPPEGEGRRGL